MVDYSPEEVIALSIIFMILPIIAAGLRVWAVRIKGASFAADDYTIFPALLVLIGLCAVTIYGVIYGDFAKHQALGPGDKLVFSKAIQTYYICDFLLLLLSILTVGLCKISVLLLYHRIFPLRTMKIASVTLLTISVIWTIGFTLITIFQCHPVQYYWEETGFMYKGKCLDPITLVEVQVVTDILLDFSILVLPLPVIWNLQLPIKQKVSLAGLLLLGVLASSAGIAKIAVFFSTANQVTKELTGLTYLTTPVFIWNLIEASLSVTCTCLPTLRPIFFREKFRTKTKPHQGRHNIYYASNDEHRDVYSGSRVLRSFNPIEATSWIDLEMESFGEGLDIGVGRASVTERGRGGGVGERDVGNLVVLPGPRNGRALPRF